MIFFTLFFKYINLVNKIVIPQKSVIANLWSVLFTTGYLTKQGVTDDGKVRLSIPNREIKNLFIKKSANGSAIQLQMTERHLNNSAMHLWIRILKK